MVKYLAQIVAVLSMLAVTGDQVLKMGFLSEEHAMWVLFLTNMASAALPNLRNIIEKTEHR